MPVEPVTTVVEATETPTHTAVKTTTSTSKPPWEMVKIIASVIALIVFAEGALAMAALKWGVADWNIVNGICANLNVLAMALTTGLFALIKGNSGA